MTYALRETAPIDHENHDIALSGVYGNMTIEEYFSGMSEDARSVMDEFDELWDGVSANLQWPIEDDGSKYGGFTGHRIVTFDGQMGRCALGFQLARNGGDLHRTIVAYRRKIYASNRRRVAYTSDELAISAQEVASNPHSEKMAHRLGVLGVWLDKYNAASC